jgi:hypothetical protein
VFFTKTFFKIQICVQINLNLKRNRQKETNINN